MVLPYVLLVSHSSILLLSKVRHGKTCQIVLSLPLTLRPKVATFQPPAVSSVTLAPPPLTDPSVTWGQVAELPHVTAERFRERVLAQQALQPSAPAADGPLYCQPCRKPFKTDAQHRNHVITALEYTVSDL